MAEFPCKQLQGTTRLCLKKVIPLAQTNQLIADGILRCPPDGLDQWKLVLFEEAVSAIAHTAQIRPQGRAVAAPISRASHLMLEVEFTSMGVAYFVEHCQGAEYKFGSFLRKMTHTHGDDNDPKTWHFHGDLPLQAVDRDDHLLITSRLVDIP